LRGLDLFHNRFALDPRLNRSSRTVINQFSDKLERLEEGQKAKPHFGTVTPARGSRSRIE
jgi:hypothetical protein